MTTNYNVASVHQMVLEDSRIKVIEIAEAMDMSKEPFLSHIDSRLGYEKVGCHVCSHWAKNVFEMQISNALLA